MSFVYKTDSVVISGRAVAAEVEQRESDDTTKIQWNVELKQLMTEFKQKAQADLEAMSKTSLDESGRSKGDHHKTREKDKFRRKSRKDKSRSASRDRRRRGSSSRSPSRDRSLASDRRAKVRDSLELYPSMG